MSRLGDIRSFQITWQGIALAVTYEANALALADSGVATSAYIGIIAENRRPLPFTDIGYRSHFIDPADIETEGGPAAYVLAWLEQAAHSPQCRSRTVAADQLSLF